MVVIDCYVWPPQRRVVRKLCFQVFFEGVRLSKKKDDFASMSSAAEYGRFPPRKAQQLA